MLQRKPPTPLSTICTGQYTAGEEGRKGVTNLAKQGTISPWMEYLIDSRETVRGRNFDRSNLIICAGPFSNPMPSPILINSHVLVYSHCPHHVNVQHLEHAHHI
jgi:hypothetical protein